MTLGFFYCQLYYKTTVLVNIRYANGNDTDPVGVVRNIINTMRAEGISIGNGDKVYCLIDADVNKNCSKEWKERIEKAFGVNPLTCEKCGAEMEFTDIYYWKCGSLLAKIYENMQKKLDKEIAEEEKRIKETRLIEGEYEWAV